MNADHSALLYCLDRSSVQFLIIGGYAFIEHVEPRQTKDIDIWISRNVDNLERVHVALREFLKSDDSKWKDCLFALGSPERQGDVLMVTYGVPPQRADIVTSVEGLDFEGSWAKRHEGSIGGQKVFYISTADLQKSKELAGRPQDLVDLNRMRAVLNREQDEEGY